MELRARIPSLLLATVLSIAPTLAAATSFNETVNGDMSGERLAPSSLALELGSNEISGMTIASDLDYLTIHVPDGAVLAQLVLTSFVSEDDRAFIAIQAGKTFTTPADAPDVTVILGYTHLSLPLVGLDLLPTMGTGPAAIGFAPPLPSGDYTLWLQQITPQSVAYSLNAVVSAPEPELLLLLCFALVGLAVLRPSLASVD